MRYKFRAWDINNKKMFRVDRIDYRDDNFGIREVRRVTEYPINVADQMYYDLLEIELMQFTGLTDVNGVEIYEGDILRLLNSEVLCEVVYEAPSFCRRWINKKVSSLRGVEMESMAHNTHIAYEVIGNIHQNKDLLKEF